LLHLDCKSKAKNNSDYYTLYSVILKQENGEFKGQDFGSLEAKERVHLASIQPSQADNWANGALQLLFHKDNDDKVFMPVSYQLKLRTAKFYKEGCFEYNDLTGCKAMVLPVAMIKDLQLFAVKGEEKVTKPIKEENQEAKPIAEKKPVSFFDKYMVNRLEAEVDLHIEELTEDDSKMQPFEKLTLQMEHFNKCLDEAIKRNLDKIVFIHGVGQGVLKKNIEEELNKYSFIHYFPASMQKYGVGATEVIIGKNRK
ncbi:MAG: DUF2027 domain-containing protein, partial [Bacteroidales bacterium]|nr:DUF2027 domain-containing protein [Bacteroidales bacterium]